MADLVAAATLLFRDRFSAGISAAAREMDRATDRMTADAERMARTTSRAGGRAGRAVGGLARDTRDAGRDTGRSTRLMDTAWKGLDILDDISGVAGMVWDLSAGLREAAAESVAMSREVELAMARINSIEAAEGPDAEVVPGVTSAALRTHARLFATGRGGAVSEVVGLREIEFITAAKEALSAGFEQSAAIALTKYAAGLGAAAEGSMGDAARLLRPMYALLADPAADAEGEVARLADQVARTQALYDIPSLPLLTEAITTAAPLAGQHGISSDVLLAALGAFHSAGTGGSEAGEAFNSILEEITSGLEELGLAKVETAGGGMDFPATVARLREFRLQSGLSDTAWVDRLVDVFGELGGRQLATITSAQTYQRFTGGLPEIAESEGVMQRRLEPLADTRAMRLARLEAMKASNQRVFGDTQARPIADAWLGFRELWQRSRTGRNDTHEYLSTGYHPVLRPAGIELDTGLSAAEVEAKVAFNPAAFWTPEMFAKDDAAGRAIPETLAAGIEKARPALGAALDRTLRREVDERLPHSDARRGPLAHLTTSGRSIPETLAVGVAQGAGALDAAVAAALPAPPAIAVPPPIVADAVAADLEPPAAPALPPLVAASAVADLEPPALPTLPPLVADTFAADLDPPVAPTLAPPLVAASAVADLEPPALPTLPPLIADTFATDLKPAAIALADPASNAEGEVARLADQAARTQGLYDIPSLPLLTDAITTAAPLAGQHGISSEVLLAALGAFHSAGTGGSEAGEAFNSILEEIASGLEELGLARVGTAAGGMDFPATVARLREFRLQSDLSDTAWVDRLVDAFGELGGRQLATITSEQTYQRFTAGLPEIAESADTVAADLNPRAATPQALSPAPALLPQSPLPSDLLAAVRDLTREIRRLRTESGGAGVTIERVELHAEDADLMRAAEGLAALRGGP